MMEFCDAVAVILVLLLVVMIVVKYLPKKAGMDDYWMAQEADQPIPNLTKPYEYAPDGYVAKDAYGVLNMQLDGIRGEYGPSLGRESRFAGSGLPSFYRSGMFMRPRDYELLNRISWFDNPNTTKGLAIGCSSEMPKPPMPMPGPAPVQPGETESAIDKKEGFAGRPGMLSDESEISDAAAIGVAEAAAKIGMRSCKPDINADSNDYGTYMRSLIADDRMLQNHAAWVKEVQPFSQTSLKINDFDIEPYVDFIGLRRPQAVAVYNPTQLTELAPEDLAPNKKFDFQG